LPRYSSSVTGPPRFSCDGDEGAPACMIVNWSASRSGAAPCQCSTPAGVNHGCPGCISCMGPPRTWCRPRPSSIMSSWPHSE
jgi:hypothetical protein